MRYVVGVFFLLHGFAHLVGFAVPWRLGSFPDAPYKTTVLGGNVDVGAAGIRIIGILWLLLAVAFAVVGVATLTSRPWWRTLALAAAIASLVLSLLDGPEARIGVVVNLAILAFLFLAAQFDWLAAAPR